MIKRRKRPDPLIEAKFAARRATYLASVAAPKPEPESVPKSGAKKKTGLHVFQRTSGGPWYVRLQGEGVRKDFNTGTTSKATALVEAKKRKNFLLVNGWQALLEKYNPKAFKATLPPTTIGAMMDSIEANTRLRRKTVRAYKGSIYRVAGDIAKRPRFKLGPQSSAYNEKIVAQIRALPLSILSLDNMKAWTNAYMADNGKLDPVAQGKRETSCNVYLNHVKGFLGDERLEDLKVTLPSLKKLKTFNAGSKRFVELVDVNELFRACLAERGVEEQKAFLLCLVGGLRKNEADKLRWEQFLWDNNQIRVKTTQYFKLKVNTASGDVPIDPEIMQMFNQWHLEDLSAEFVLKGFSMDEADPDPDPERAEYRAAATWRNLTKWLRTKGVNPPDRKPLHYLRKAGGSAICKKLGIYAAKLFLRHSRVRTTEDFYISAELTATAGFGQLVGESPKIVEFSEKKIASSR
jgi:integrase